VTSMWIGDDLEAVLSPERAILARREELREQRAADKLAAEREERAETRQWQLEHSGKQPHTHQEILAAWARTRSARAGLRRRPRSRSPAGPLIRSGSTSSSCSGSNAKGRPRRPTPRASSTRSSPNSKRPGNESRA